MGHFRGDGNHHAVRVANDPVAARDPYHSCVGHTIAFGKKKLRNHPRTAGPILAEVKP